MYIGITLFSQYTALTTCRRITAVKIVVENGFGKGGVPDP